MVRIKVQAVKISITEHHVCIGKEQPFRIGRLGAQLPGLADIAMAPDDFFGYRTVCQNQIGGEIVAGIDGDERNLRRDGAEESADVFLFILGGNDHRNVFQNRLRIFILA